MSIPWSSDVDEFLALLLVSDLLSVSTLRAACDGFDRQALENDELDAICSHLIAEGYLTEWQSELLRSGKYKGFRLDNYILLDALSRDEKAVTYLAKDIATGNRVALAVTATRIAPPRNARPERRVARVFDD